VPSLPELKIGTKVALEIKHIDTLLMELNSKFKHVVAEVEADLEKEAVVDEVESE
jgi:exoribonuclease-2